MVNCIKCPLFALGCNSNIIGELGDFIKFYGKIPDILVLITGHFGLFKTPTLRLGEAGKIQTQSQTQRLRIAKTDFKSARKTIANLGIILKMGENFQIQHSIYNASLCYIRLFCSLESTLREIYLEFGYIPKKKNSFIQFSEISSTIINDFKLDKKYIKLLELLATIRNLMHEFGVSNKNKEIKYNGKTYKFEKGKFPKAEMVKLVSLLEFYRIDVLTLMDQMFQTEKFKNKQYIKDYLSPNKQHYKNWINGK